MSEPTLPSGVTSIFIEDKAAKKYGLKKGPAAVDLINRKIFNTDEILNEIKTYGFMCPFQPYEKYLRECVLEEFIVVCDASSKYGEMFLLLYELDAIDNFHSPVELEEKRDVEAKIKVANETEATEAAKMERTNAVFVVKPIVPRPYSSLTSDMTAKEMEALLMKDQRPLIKCVISLSEARQCGKNREFSSHRISSSFRPHKSPTHLTCMQKEVSTQAVEITKVSTTQTTWNRKADKIMQYSHLKLKDFGLNLDKMWVEIASFVSRVTPLIEQCLQENETVDIFSDYLNDFINENTPNSICPEEENAVKELRNFTDLEFSKGKTVSCIEAHPTNADFIAVSVGNPRPMEEPVLAGCRDIPSYIILWQFGLQIHPALVLRAPFNCPIFRFNPTLSNILVAGCTNGQVALWDISEYCDVNPASSTQNAYVQGKRTINKDQTSDAIGTRIPLAPSVLSHPESSHKRMVADIVWLPSHVQINMKGRLLPKEHLTSDSYQFFTVSGDGHVLFWDIRFEEIMMGKLPHIAKVKGVKQPQLQSQQYDSKTIVCRSTKWAPIFKIKPKRLEGTGELSLCKAMSYHQLNTTSDDASSSKIICASQEGELLSLDWSPKSQLNTDGTEKDGDREFASQEYVQWMKLDHNRPCSSLCRSPFFPDFVLSVSDWNFHIWKTDTEPSLPVFSSPYSSCHHTGGRWSPTRPAVVVISKENGSLDVWDFTEICHSPSATLQLIPSSIVSMEFIVSEEGIQMLAIGDKVGSLHVFDLARNLTRCYPREIDSMEKFLDREAQLQSTMSARNVTEAINVSTEGDLVSSTFSSDKNIGHSDETQHEALTKEEEDLYDVMENAFLNA